MNVGRGRHRKDRGCSVCYPNRAGLLSWKSARRTGVFDQFPACDAHAPAALLSDRAHRFEARLMRDKWPGSGASVGWPG